MCGLGSAASVRSKRTMLTQLTQNASKTHPPVHVRMACSRLHRRQTPAAGPACMGVPACQGQVREFLSCAPGFSSSAAVSVACVDVEYRVPGASLAPDATRPAGRPGDASGAETRASAGACSDLRGEGQGHPGVPSESTATWQASPAATVSEGAWSPLRCCSVLEQQAIPALDPGLSNSLLRLHDLRRLSQHQDGACPGGQHASAPVFVNAPQSRLPS